MNFFFKNALETFFLSRGGKLEGIFKGKGGFRGKCVSKFRYAAYCIVVCMLGFGLVSFCSFCHDIASLVGSILVFLVPFRNRRYSARMCVYLQTVQDKGNKGTCSKQGD